MKKALIFWIVLILFFSCVKQDNVDSAYFKESCFNEVVVNYILKNEPRIAITYINNKPFYDIFYSIFLFRKDSSCFFTMWCSYYPNDENFIDNPKYQVVNDFCFRLFDRDIHLFIGCRKINEIMMLYLKNICLSGCKIKNDKLVDFPIYDGSLYPETYKIEHEGKKIEVKKLENPTIDFSIGWEKYELYLKER